MHDTTSWLKQVITILECENGDNSRIQRVSQLPRPAHSQKYFKVVAGKVGRDVEHRLHHGKEQSRGAGLKINIIKESPYLCENLHILRLRFAFLDTLQQFFFFFFFLFFIAQFSCSKEMPKSCAPTNCREAATKCKHLGRRRRPG